MIGVVATVLTSFGLLIAHSLRKARRLAAEGRPYAPAGRVRWDSTEV